MFARAEGAGGVQLVLTDTSTAVATTTGALLQTIPDTCVARSALIAALREEVSDEVNLPLPLSVQDLEAWLACTASADGATHDDDTLLRALKAADFLQDDQTTTEVTEGLAEAVCEAVQQHDDDGKHTREASEMAPAAISPQARACKIVRTVPPSSVLTILTLAHTKHHSAKPTSSQRRRHRISAEEKLLLLLPRSFHPTIMKACSLPTSDPRCNNLWAMYG